MPPYFHQSPFFSSQCPSTTKKSYCGSLWLGSGDIAPLKSLFDFRNAHDYPSLPGHLVQDTAQWHMFLVSSSTLFPVSHVTLSFRFHFAAFIFDELSLEPAELLPVVASMLLHYFRNCVQWTSVIFARISVFYPSFTWFIFLRYISITCYIWTIALEILMYFCYPSKPLFIYSVQVQARDLYFRYRPNA